MAKKQPTFEEALAKLESIVEAIEQGKVGLEESIERYEEGMALIKHCRKILAGAEQKIQKLQLAETGELTAEPLEEPSDQAPAEEETQ